VRPRLSPEPPKALDRLRQVSQERLGSVLDGKWRLDELLGVGGMAAVYAATHRNGHRVAVKILHAHCAANENICSRFQREGYVANLIEHAGAVRVLDDDRSDDGTVYLVMELLEGETLHARLNRDGRFSAAEAATLVHRVLDVLAAAHAKGIVHRDIKLDNLFLTKSGDLKVLDFGIARLAESATGEGDPIRTDVGAMLGTPAFMAPEQALARSDLIDAQTDLWAVGATLFRLLTGRSVHEAPTVNEQLVKAATEHAPPLLSVLETAPANLACIVDRALAFRKAERWASAKDMRDALELLLEAKDQDALPAESPLPMRPPDSSATGANMTRAIAVRPPAPLAETRRDVGRRASTSEPIRRPPPSESAPPTGASVVAEVAPPQARPRRSVQLSFIGALAIALTGSLALWSRSSLPTFGTPPASVSAAARPSPPPSISAEPASTAAPETPPAPPTDKPPGKRRGEKKGPPSNRLITDDEETFGRRH
jgi:serine/threonine-protein kinase